MPVTVTTRGWIELYRDGALVSRHNVESEAIERAVAHAEANGDGDYELRYPNKVVRVSLLQKTVIPFAWNTVAISFNQGTPASVNLASFLRNDQGYPITFGVLGSLPTGVTHAAGVLTYNGQGSPASAQVTFTASSGPFVATSGSSSVAIADVNQGPYWSSAPATLSGNAGAQVAFGQYANDPDGDALTFSIVAHPGGCSVNASSGLVTLGSSSGPLTLRATDPAGLYADHVCQVTVITASALIRFAPGHYIRPGLGDSLDSVLSKLATYDARVRGIALFRYWREMEPTKGDYSWTWFDAVFDACAQYNKRVLARVQDRAFNTMDPAVACPDWAIAEGLSYASNNRAGTALWRTAAMDRSILAYQAIIGRYRHRVSADGKPILIGTYGEESIYSKVDDNYPEYTPAILVTQELRRANTLRSYAPELCFWWLTNWITPTGTTETDAQMVRWFTEACRADPGIFCSYGPDTRWISGSNIQGRNCITGALGGVDHRGPYGMIGWTENLEWGASPPKTVSEIYAAAVTDCRANFMVWSTNPAEWLDQAYPYIATHPAITAVPSALYGLVQEI